MGVTRKFGSVLAGTVLVSGVVLVGSPAQADTPGCVTKTEFRSVEHGWKKARVHRVFDTRGHQTYYDSGGAYSRPEQWREYRACFHPRWSSIEVDYVKRQGVWRVSLKSAFWI
jgi:hypothetical protein